MALLSASITPTNLVTTSGAATLSNKTFSDNPTFSGGTANGVPYLNGSKVLTSGSDLVFNGTNFGIGTSSPTGKLEVSGSTSLLVSKVTNTNSAGQAASQLLTDTTALYSAAFGTTAGGTTWAGLTGNKQVVIEAQDSSSFVIGAFNNSVPIIFAQGRAETARFPVNGGFQSKTTIGVGDAAPSSSGAGITFPASQSASSDANTLDDYEEGTWTPVVSDAASGGNLATLDSGATSGVYTKIGNVVYWRFSVVLTSKASMTAGNEVFIQGFPFQSAAIAGSWYNPFPTIIRNITFTDFVQFNQVGNTTYGYLRENVSNANGDNIIASDCTNSAAIQASGFYRVA